MAVNYVTVEGNLGRDPEQNGNGPVKFSICWNQRKKENDEWVSIPNWFEVVSWEREKVSAAGLTKGTRVIVTGRISEETWTDKESGQKRSKVVIVADRDGIATSLPFVERNDQPDW
jgi:single-strand DNA-binding protein